MGRELKPLSLVLILVLVLAISVTGCGKKKAVEKETELSVNVAEASVQDIAKTESFSGIIRGKNEVYIMPKVSARVTGIYVKPGDKVSAGQTLITLDNSDYQATLKRAEAGLDLAEASKRTNELNLEQARLNYERNKALHDAGAVSDQQLEDAQTRYLSLSAGTVEASVAQAQAGVMEVRQQIGNCTITSPINGVVGNINLSLGDNAMPSSQAAIITETNQLEVEVLVGESEISYIKQGSPVEVVISAVRDKPFKGTVENISTVADPAKHSYPVKVSLDNKNGLIRSGMFAEVRIPTISKSNVVCVPAKAVVPKNGRTIVYIIDKDKRARQVDVTTGIENSKYIEIVKGLKSGQQIITKGNTLINEGTLVRVVRGGSK